MTRKLTIVLLATFAILAISGTVFAGDISSEAGNYEFSFDQVAAAPAETPNYSADYLAAIGTEAGTWNVKYNDVDAQKAARDYQYDWNHLHAMGTEAGDYDAFKLSNEPKRFCILC